MEKCDILPPGQDPLDPAKKDIDPLAFALQRVQTMLVWIDEHRASFEKTRETDPKSAEIELNYLKDATGQAALHLQRLTELLLVGYAIDPDKRLPKGFGSDHWDRFVDAIREDNLKVQEKRTEKTKIA